MSTFEGFNVTGIDPNQYPVFTDDNDMRFDLFYLTLEPIGADANCENQRLWDYCFRHEVKNWDDLEGDAVLLRLKFIFDADGRAFICASGEALQTVADNLRYIERLVELVNRKFIRETGSVNRFRRTIDQINSQHFEN